MKKIDLVFVLNATANANNILDFYSRVINDAEKHLHALKNNFVKNVIINKKSVVVCTLTLIADYAQKQWNFHPHMLIFYVMIVQKLINYVSIVQETLLLDREENYKLASKLMW